MIEVISAPMLAGEAKTFLVNGDYFELIDTPSGTVDVVLSNRSGSQIYRMTNAEATFFNAPGHYEVVQITSQVAQTVRFFVADGTAGTRRTSGIVTVQQVTNTFAALAKTATNVDTQLLAGKPNRRYLLIQNNNATGAIYIAFGVAATLAAGLKIIPGGAYELAQPVTTQEIRVIGDLASNANIVTVEG